MGGFCILDSLRAPPKDDLDCPAGTEYSQHLPTGPETWMAVRGNKEQMLPESVLDQDRRA